MVGQQHKIMRQVLEARGCPRAATEPVRNALSAAYRRRLIPLIDRICSELSAPDKLHRIEHLEIDLGKFNLETLDGSLPGRFEAVFTRELAAAISAAPETDADLELFVYFIETGQVPWWADLSKPGLLDLSLAGLIGRAPWALLRAIRGTVDKERTLRRIARAFPDDLLNDLLPVMAPGLFAAESMRAGAGARRRDGTRAATPSGALRHAIETTLRARGLPSRDARNLAWEEILRAAIASTPPNAPAFRFFRDVLTRTARRIGVEYRSLVAHLEGVVTDTPRPFNARTHEIVKALLHDLDGGSSKPRGSSPSDESGPDQSSAPGEPSLSVPLEVLVSTPMAAPSASVGPTPLDALLERLERDQGRPWAELGAVLHQLPDRLKTQALAALAADPLTHARSPSTDGRTATSRELRTKLEALVRAALERDYIAPQLGAELLDSLAEPSESTASSSGTEPVQVASPSVRAKRAPLDALLERLERDQGRPWAELGTVLHQLPDRLKTQALAALAADPLTHARSPSTDGRTATSRELRSKLEALVRAALERDYIAPQLGAELLDSLAEQTIVVPRSETRIDFRSAATEELYIDNAGLVMLWPFLEPFFAHLGLLEEKAFTDPPARQRAVGLLQYLATGEAPGPEYRLALNKLLCGMPLTEVFDFGEPLTDTEIEASVDMLGAAVQHAPILRDMSIGGFRASFLLRTGQLSARDGHWLLRVERETHDIVLQRFPWSMHIVKLPWMEAMMQVEW